MADFKNLYTKANILVSKAPWDTFKDTDLICLGENAETAAYASVRNDGINFYEGAKGLNDYFLLRMSDDFGLDAETAIYSLSFLSMMRGNASELNHEQKRRISEYGLNYKDGEWISFVSYSEGYYPVEPDEDEISRLEGYVSELSAAVDAYIENGMKVPFDEGKMYIYDSSNNICETGNWPVAGYVASELIAPKGLIEDAQKMEMTDSVLEVDMQFAGTSIDDPNYLRAVNPRLVAAADAKSGEIILNKVVSPGENYAFIIAEFITAYLFDHGRPKRIKVGNGFVESVLKDLCSKCDIDLRMVRKLPKLDAYMRQTTSMIRNMDEKQKLK